MKGSWESSEAGRLCRLDNRQCQFFPGQTLRWLDALADVDMMWTESEGQDGVCRVDMGRDPRHIIFQVSALTACATPRRGTPGLEFSGACLSTPGNTIWLVMPRLPDGEMAGSIPPALALCTRSSSLTLLLSEPPHLGGCDPPSVSLPEIRHL